jgi:hypothetical protein
MPAIAILTKKDHKLRAEAFVPYHYDQRRRVRSTPGLAGLVDAQATVSAYEKIVQRRGEEGQELRTQIGRGRVFYLSPLRFRGPLPEFGAYFNRFRMSPANAQQFLEGVSWVRNGEPAVHVKGPNHLIANSVERPSKRLTAMHLVNYKPTKARLRM